MFSLFPAPAWIRLFLFASLLAWQAHGQHSLITYLTTRQQQGQRLSERLAVGHESRITQLTTPSDWEDMA